MPRVIVSPCGTSLLTNGIADGLRDLLMKTANCKEADLTPEQKQVIDKHLKERRQLFADTTTDSKTIRKLSAELNGILTYYGGEIPTSGEDKADQHYILGTDTYQGQKVTEIVVQWLCERNMTAFPKVISALSTRDIETFRVAMCDLIDWCDTTLSNYPKPGWHKVFNLTGGFKSVNGFLQAIGMFYADESVYIFQFSSELLRIPRLPITLEKEAIVGKHLEAFRRMGRKQQLSISEHESIPETLLLQDGDQVGLSEWGELVWLQAKPYYYEQKLLSPLSPKLLYSPQFEKAVEELPRERVAIINERLDQLSQCLDSNKTYNPKSLDFKELKGKPLPNSTHECNAWSDRDAKRIYGHFEADGQYKIDLLGSHL